MSLQLKYNFVFWGVSYDYLRPILGEELYTSEYVHIYKGAFEGCRLLQKFFHYHWAYKINKRINLPLKSLWFKKLYKQTFKNDLPLCFVYLGGHILLYDRGFTEYVRQKIAKGGLPTRLKDLNLTVDQLSLPVEDIKA